MNTSTESPADERAAFEAWARSEGFSTERGSRGLYTSLGTNQLFTGWLGCRASLGQPTESAADAADTQLQAAEPEHWAKLRALGWTPTDCRVCGEVALAMPAQAAVQAEPVATVTAQGYTIRLHRRLPIGAKLYLAAPTPPATEADKRAQIKAVLTAAQCWHFATLPDSADPPGTQIALRDLLREAVYALAGLPIEPVDAPQAPQAAPEQAAAEVLLVLVECENAYSALSASIHQPDMIKLAEAGIRLKAAWDRARTLVSAIEAATQKGAERG